MKTALLIGLVFLGKFAFAGDLACSDKTASKAAKTTVLFDTNERHAQVYTLDEKQNVWVPASDVLYNCVRADTSAANGSSLAPFKDCSLQNDGGYRIKLNRGGIANQYQVQIMISQMGQEALLAELNSCDTENEAGE